MANPTSKKKSTSASEEKDSKKIWVTMPTKYAEILDILSDDKPGKIRSTRKSVIIEKMIDDYINSHRESLENQGKWAKIVSALKRATNKLEEEFEVKKRIINKFIEYPEFEKYKKYWRFLLDSEDKAKIEKFYLKIEKFKEEQDAIFNEELDL